MIPGWYTSRVSGGNDLLRRYFYASDDDAEQILNEFYLKVLLPLCQRVVRARLPRHRDDVEDVTQDTVLRLVARVKQVRASGDHSSIRDVAKWAMGAASKACSDFLRTKHLLRTHLANALRYRFSKSVAFPLWKAYDGRSLCGWHRCRGVPPLTESAFQHVLALPRVASRLAGIEAEYSQKLWRTLMSVFAYAEGPIYFHYLVSELIARSVGAGERTAGLDEVPAIVINGRADDLLIRKEMLRALWQAVMKLPREERLSLLLNLRGPEGVAAWQDVVPAAEVAAAVELSPEELDRLPLNDLQIAEHLGITEANETKRRQHVINLRRSAKRKFRAYVESG